MPISKHHEYTQHRIQKYCIQPTLHWLNSNVCGYIYSHIPTDSLQKTLKLEKIESRRKRGRQRMR